MKPVSLEEIRRATRGRWLANSSDITVNNISTDSRTTKKGDLFLAIEGDNFDGHGFLAPAAKAGAVAGIIRRDREPPPDVTKLFTGGLIGVGDTVEALGDLGCYNRKLSSARVVGVTGSNGKTTVKRLIHHILSKRLTGSCSPKSFNNEIGVPLTLLGINPGDDYVVCEIGSNAPGEIASLGKISQPDITVVTCIGPSHLEGFGDLQNVAIEKASLVGSLEKSGFAVVFADSEELNLVLRSHKAKFVRFGKSKNADLRLSGYESQGRNCRFQVNGRFWVDLPLPGKHNAMNALAAIAVAQRFGFSQEEAAEALKDFDGVDMRLEWIGLDGLTVINDAYNANPASVSAAVDVLADCQTTRKVAVLGDMLELGSAAEVLHEKLGENIAKRQVDFLISVGPLGRYIAKGAQQAGLRAQVFDSVQFACEGIAELLCKGDTVLIKGSRAMEMERLIEPIRRAFLSESP